jgi:carbamoyltransferase
MAFIIARNGVLGLFQGPAETGPRALGHRSILANAANPETREVLNAGVKFRETVRPLAPMLTREAAGRLFELSEGAAADDYNAYNYMVLTVMAKPEARRLVPAVIHHDGTARIQIVRRETNPLCHAVLKALGRRIGVEVAVNTSLNVGSPIVQTPEQALEALRRAKGMTGVALISATGETRIAYHDVVDGPKDAGRQLRSWIDEWQTTNPTAVSMR